MRRLREAIPGVQFTTDMIVGFPGETDEEFEKTLAFIREAKFLMIHVFPYSRRAGTEADRMDGQIPESVKHARVKRLSEEQARIRAALLSEQIGSCQEVLFETLRDGLAYGHTPNFIEVVCPAERICTAQTHTVRITETDGSICRGELLKHE